LQLRSVVPVPPVGAFRRGIRRATPTPRVAAVPPRPRVGNGFRPDIQGLRGVAALIGVWATQKVAVRASCGTDARLAARIRIRVRRLAFVAVFVLLAIPSAVAHAGDDAIFGVIEDGVRWTWPTVELQLAPLHPLEIGVSLHTDCEGSVPSLGMVPPTQPVLVTLLGPGSPRTPCLGAPGVAAYARGLVRENPNIREIQVWNEVDLCWWPCYGAERKPRFQGVFLDRYLDLLAATHDALAGTGVKVLGFGLSPRIGSKWTASGLAAGIARWYESSGWTRPVMDGFAWHPYCRYEDAVTAQIVSAFDTWVADRINDPGPVAEYSLPQPTPSQGLKIWWTETGLDTGSSAGEHGYTNVESGITSCAHGTEDQQAERVGEVASLARSNPYVAADFNFLLTDQPDLKYWQTGFYRPDGTAKPALDAFEKAVR
jgi:hypothetical protein